MEVTKENFINSNKNFVSEEEYDQMLHHCLKLIEDLNKEKMSLMTELNKTKKELGHYQRLMRRQIKRWENEHNINLSMEHNIVLSQVQNAMEREKNKLF